MVNNQEQKRLKKARAFDQKVLTEIYEEFYPPIYRYIYRQVGDVETTRDLTAEVFHHLLQSLQRRQGPTQSLKAWLYRTAHNRVIDHYRRQQHRQHMPLSDELAGNYTDLLTLAEQSIAADEVREALQLLTPDQQQVIALKFLQGLSNKETAEILDKPVSAIKSLQHRALASLQRQLVSTKKKVLL